MLAVDYGCGICNHIWMYSSDATPLSYVLLPDWNPGGNGRGFVVKFSGYNPNFTLVALPLTEMHDLARRSRSRRYDGHEDVAALAAKWLSHCKSNHSRCSVSRGWKPSRLLEVSTDSVKLINGCEVQRDDEYATLSYCWGRSSFFVLNTSTMDQFRKGVDIKELPLTIQHAVLTVQRLKIKYLWVDAYCIIQGNDSRAQEDWEHESQSMGKVYQNGLLNIGAATTEGANMGMFGHRKSSWMGPMTIQMRVPGEGYKLFQMTSDTEYPFSQFESSPLLRRGWVLQEYVLSRRMLSFTPDDVIWQCLESNASEVDPDLTAELYDRESLINKPLFWVMTSSWMAVHGMSGKKALQYGWFTALDHYVTTTLTFPDKDVFRAIQGIGYEMQKLTGQTFAHGTLSDTLLPSLLWEDNHWFDHTELRRQPSWHWSSLDTPRNFFSVCCIYESHGNGYNLPLAYPFMSDDCTPLATMGSQDFWPKLFVIGRLLDPRPLRLMDSRRRPASSSDFKEGDMYLPLLVVGRWRLNTRYDEEGLVVEGIHLRKLSDGTFRRVNKFRSGQLDVDLLPAQLAAAKPRLIILS